jgi:alpha-ketoglutarate-dependent taurine dioxygenase
VAEIADLRKRLGREMTKLKNAQATIAEKDAQINTIRRTLKTERLVRMKWNRENEQRQQVAECIIAGNGAAIVGLRTELQNERIAREKEYRENKQRQQIAERIIAEKEAIIVGLRTELQNERAHPTKVDFE